MRKYGMKETKEIKKIICNKCGREITAVNGILSEDELTVEKRSGYFYRKDKRVDRFELCQEC